MRQFHLHLAWVGSWQRKLFFDQFWLSIRYADDERFADCHDDDIQIKKPWKDEIFCFDILDHHALKS